MPARPFRVRTLSTTVVVAGPGSAPARGARRINGVLTAVRAMVVHAVSTGQADGHLVSHVV